MYLCHPGIIVGIVYCIIIGSASLYYMYVLLRNSKVSQAYFLLIFFTPRSRIRHPTAKYLIAMCSVPSELIRMSCFTTQEWRDELAYKIWRMKERMRSPRRLESTATSYNPKTDVELTTVDPNNNPPEDAEPTMAGNNDNSKTDVGPTPALKTGDKHPESQNDDTNAAAADRDVEHADGAPVAPTTSHHVHFGNPP